MSFVASAGRIYATDGATVVFDTDEKVFTATNGPITGSITTTPYTAAFEMRVVDHVIAAVNAAADTVRGAVSITVSGTNRGITNKGWFNASGTLIVGMREVWAPLSGSTNTVAIGSVVTFCFLVSGGNLILRERHRISSPALAGSPTTTTVEAHTLNYQLFAGTFV